MKLVNQYGLNRKGTDDEMLVLSAALLNLF